MIKTAITIIASAVCISTAAQNLASVKNPVRDLEYHLRLAPARTSATDCTLFWNYTDSANYRSISFVIPAVTDDSPIFGFSSSYSLVNRTGGIDSLIESGNISSSYPTGDGLGFSAILKVVPTGASVSLGGETADNTVEIQFDHINPGSIGYNSSSGLTEIRNTVIYSSLPEPKFASFPSLEDLLEYLSNSTDGYEGVWSYLDRDTAPEKADLGGRYSIATVASQDGSYDIIYLTGAMVNAGRWLPLQLKGHLRPTIFRDHFDLIWYDADGSQIDSETSADFDIQGSVLKLNFPLLDSSVRFRASEIKKSFLH